MKQINNLIVVEVPDDAYDFKIWRTGITMDRSGVYYVICKPRNERVAKFSEKENIEILGTLSDLSEEECSRFVSKGYSKYKNYKEIYEYNFETAKESLISLLQSDGVDTTKNLLIIEKL